MKIQIFTIQDYITNNIGNTLKGISKTSLDFCFSKSSDSASLQWAVVLVLAETVSVSLPALTGGLRGFSLNSRPDLQLRNAERSSPLISPADISN